MLKKEGFDPKPEIMVPLVGTENELKQQQDVIKAAAKELFTEEGMEVEFKLGTMIEIPRAALTADLIAKHADYFSFGTNDLTQMTFGYSRDDVARFLPTYLDGKVIKQVLVSWLKWVLRRDVLLTQTSSVVSVVSMAVSQVQLSSATV